MAIAQPFAVNGISKLVLDWFDAGEVIMATGLGTAGMFIGIALGLATTPPMVEAWGMQGAMIAWAGISVVIADLSVACIRTDPNAHQAPPAEPSILANLCPLLKSRPLVLLFAVAALGLGYFNA